MKTYMFPGQGSQKKGMGADLFDKYPDLVAIADEILGYSIKELCLEDPRKELGKTQFTQPALYVVNALSYYDKIDSNREKPDFVAGHSLGEFNALLAAEVFGFDSGLKLVKKRGELMSQVSGGGMAAVVNVAKEEVESILKTNGLDNIDLANFNTGSQIVISGMKEEIERAGQFFCEGMMQFHLLKTSGAFHSRFMESSMKQFEGYLKKFKLGASVIPVISNVTAEPYKDGEILKNLSLQIARSVKWDESVQFLMKQGANAGCEMEFVECGHGNVLTGLVRKIKREVAKSAKQGIKKVETPAKATVAEAAPTTVVEAAPTTVVEAAPTTVVEAQPAVSVNREFEKPQGFINAEQLVKNWNDKYSIGTQVKSTKGGYQGLQTRTEAMVLFGHRAAVYMKDYKGYFDLNELETL